ncbi:MAG TPA: tRNA pseudouridine(55) synthase TruB [Chloroflexota bacterium]|jgi:tRNA pseudouridine55 synthase|nr:tRNA pseudouridine(55) synthase TruB [Chloroflexota bacterium]
MAEVAGFLNLCKPLGWTSHDVVQLVRRRLRMQRVGHAGTLDPAASGVLPVCLGRATRLAERVAAGSKLYVADAVLGVATDTHDAEGRVTATAPPAPLTLDAVVRALAAFVGTFEQRPPAFSALKVGGEPSYARARRGQEVQLAPRRVTVYGLALLAWQPPRVSFALRCSKGTYVRALVRDLGEALGCGAYLDGLVRWQVGPFTLAEAVSIEQFEEAVARGTWPALLWPPDQVLLDLPAVVVGAAKARYLAHGRAWAATGRARGEARAYAVDGRFLGVLRAHERAHQWQPVLSFVYDPGDTGDS